MSQVPPDERGQQPERASDTPSPFDIPPRAEPVVGGATPPPEPPPREPVYPDAPAYATTGVPHYLPPAAPQFPAGAAPAVAAPAERRRRSGRSAATLLRELAETIVLALLIFLLVRAVVQNFQVEGRSMEPTLQTEWYLLVNKALYWEINLETVDKFLPFIDPGDDPTRYIFRGPKRGDIIVFEAPDRARGAAERDFIKRVIALPGEVVEIKDGIVFIDGKPLDESYTLERSHETCTAQVIPPGHYFVMGDNRNNSSDSRSWGPLPKENIIGQAWLTYWPFDSFGFVQNTSVEPDANGQEPLPKDEIPLAETGRECTQSAAATP